MKIEKNQTDFPLRLGHSHHVKKVPRPNSRVLSQVYYNLTIYVSRTRLVTYAMDKNKQKDRQGAVHKIKCCDCHAAYIGEAGRNISTPGLARD